MLLRAIEPQAYALLRIVAGFLFLWHGTQKIFGFPPAPFEIPPAVQWVAGSIELVGGILVMVGLFTHWAAFLCSGLMAFAYWIAHGSPTNGVAGLLPILNNGELAVIYCFLFLFLSARGSGIWSVDALRSGAAVEASRTTA